MLAANSYELLELRREWRAHELAQLVFVDLLERHFGMHSRRDTIIRRRFIVASAARDIIMRLCKQACDGYIPRSFPEPTRAAIDVLGLRYQRTDQRERKLDLVRRGIAERYARERVKLLREVAEAMDEIGELPSVAVANEITYWNTLVEFLLL